MDSPGNASESTNAARKTIAVLPVKRFDAAKSRLADGLDAAARRRLCEAMLRDVLVQLSDCDDIDQLIVVSSEPRVAELAPDVLITREDADVSHSAAAAAGVRLAIAHGATTVALLPGDCPMVRSVEIDSLIRTALDHDVAVCIVPDHTGTGTNALVLSPPDVIAPAFGPGSRERHLQLAAAAGVAANCISVRGLALDVDTGEDCAALANQLEGAGHTALHSENAVAEIMLNRHRLPGGLAR